VRTDGVFGTATRAALLAWQRSAGRPETGFFSNADATILLPDHQASPPDGMAAYRMKPLARADYAGKPVTVAYKNLQATVQR
jgi:peptidoglycan hydrolase-like protein with peptidoglycan-binding domain